MHFIVLQKKQNIMSGWGFALCSRPHWISLQRHSPGPLVGWEGACPSTDSTPLACSIKVDELPQYFQY